MAEIIASELLKAVLQRLASEAFNAYDRSKGIHEELKKLLCNMSESKFTVHLLALHRQRGAHNRKVLRHKVYFGPDRPANTDKLAILGDVIRVLNQHKSESQDFKEMNEKLSKEIKTLKRRTSFVKRNLF